MEFTVVKYEVYCESDKSLIECKSGEHV